MSIAASVALGAFLFPTQPPQQVGPPTPLARRAERARPPGVRERPNLVLIVADDLGVDLVGAYGEASAPPCTPNVDALAQAGLLFRNAWANPTCSPTRATLLTGRYGFRTGVGNPMGANLALSERTLPELLDGYDSAAVGKWHLGGNDPFHPQSSGFARYSGSLGGALADYFDWLKTENGVQWQTTTYATTDAADEAIDALQSMQEPWFLYLAFNAPHEPFHAPPTSLCSCCANLGPNPSTVALGKAMVEAMDVEIGRVLSVVDAIDPDAYVVFVGDNGSPRQLTQLPFRRNHAKGTLYEGGVNVPLIVRGPGVAAGECAALVSCTDLFATLAELAGAESSAEDSVSMVPYFQGGIPSLRDTVYAESFSPNGGPPYQSHVRAVREARYKLIRASGAADELYDLVADPFEQVDLFPGLVPGTGAWDAYQDLAAELVALGVN